MASGVPALGAGFVWGRAPETAPAHPEDHTMAATASGTRKKARPDLVAGRPLTTPRNPFILFSFLAMRSRLSSPRREAYWPRGVFWDNVEGTRRPVPKPGGRRQGKNAIVSGVTSSKRLSCVNETASLARCSWLPDCSDGHGAISIRALSASPSSGSLE